jgi:hypothetical protein
MLRAEFPCPLIIERIKLREAIRVLRLRAGGYFYRQITGGDSFTCMQWTAEPGQESDYSDYLGNLGIVDDAQPFDHEVEGIDLSQAGY